MRRRGEVPRRSLIPSHVWDLNLDRDTPNIDVAVRPISSLLVPLLCSATPNNPSASLGTDTLWRPAPCGLVHMAKGPYPAACSCWARCQSSGTCWQRAVHHGFVDLAARTKPAADVCIHPLAQRRAERHCSNAQCTSKEGYRRQRLRWNQSCS